MQLFTIGDTQLEIYVPDKAAIQETYGAAVKDAYWAQVWPAAWGLCFFLQKHPQYIRNKTVLELAAGLGLPGLFASRQAKQVCITDREQQAMYYVEETARHQGLLNVTTAVMDWKAATKAPRPDTLLLSDVNYDPAVFPELQLLVEHFLQHATTIIISTPQRLVAKSFINRVLPFTTLQWSRTVLLNEKETGVSVFVLEKR